MTGIAIANEFSAHQLLQHASFMLALVVSEIPTLKLPGDVENLVELFLLVTSLQMKKEKQ